MFYLQPGSGGRGWGRNLQKCRHGLKTQTQSEEAGFKEKLIQVEGLHIFNFKVLMSEKISQTVHGMHTHMEMLLPTCRPHFQVRKGQLLTSERRGRDIRVWQLSLRQVSYFQSIRSPLPSSLTESWGKGHREGAHKTLEPLTCLAGRGGGEQAFPVQGAQSSPGCPAAQSAQGLFHEASLHWLSLGVSMG